MADLRGYRRTLNKASVKNWGSVEHPGLKLHITSDPSGTCRGIAFGFPDQKYEAVMAYLRKRQGGLLLRTQEVNIAGHNGVTAVVPLYEGKNLLCEGSLDDIVRMVGAAIGSSGRCIDYVTKLHSKLGELGIADPAATAVVDGLLAVEKRRKATRE